jgi:lipopolysaccharide transport system ATP-binding protein
MTHIIFKNVSVHFPIGNDGRSGVKSYISKKLGFDQRSSNIPKLELALDGISFSIHSGEKIGIIGGNGAGKTTLLRTISSVYEPCIGSIDINGSIRSLLELSFGMDQEATGRENLVLRAELLGIDRLFYKNNIDDVIVFSELGDKIDRQIKTYSSGMLLKLAFAISTIGSPDILLMDEWLSVGDDRFRKKAEVKLLNIIRSANIFILATHDMNLVKNVCTRVIFMNKGKIAYDGPLEGGIELYLEKK